MKLNLLLCFFIVFLSSCHKGQAPKEAIQNIEYKNGITIMTKLPEAKANFSIIDASIKGNQLNLTLSASGCDLQNENIHIFAALGLADVYPPEVYVKVVLDNLGICSQYIVKKVSLDLTPLQYKNKASGTKGVLTINIDGWNKSLTYNY